MRSTKAAVNYVLQAQRQCSVANKRQSLIDKGFTKSRRQIYELIGLYKICRIASLWYLFNSAFITNFSHTRSKASLIGERKCRLCLADVRGGQKWTRNEQTPQDVCGEATWHQDAHESIKPLTPWTLWNQETFDTIKPMKPRNHWHHETYETMRPMTPRNLWNRENIDTTKPIKPKTHENMKPSTPRNL